MPTKFNINQFHIAMKKGGETSKWGISRQVGWFSLGATPASRWEASPLLFIQQTENSRKEIVYD